MSTGSTILDSFFYTAPSDQNALDVMRGEWWSCFPPPYSHLRAGNLPLFDDPRVSWACTCMGGVTGQTVLELGPLEGGHSFMLEKAGAKEIVAVEANQRAFLKCLIVKEIFTLKRVHFLCGDFEEYLRGRPRHFDICLASGVLYHMRNPAEVIEGIAAMADTVYIWTQYYIAEKVEVIPHIASKINPGQPAEHSGFKHLLHRYNYHEFLDTTRFAGGSQAHSNWLNREDLLACLQYFGFTHIRIGEDEPDHVNGPAITLVASKKPLTP